MLNPILLLKKNKLYASRCKGQNFLINKLIIKYIIDFCQLYKNSNVLEIGAGFGALTIPLAGLVDYITAIEIDNGIFNILQKILNKLNIKNVNLLLNDVLKLDLCKLINNNKKLSIIGNLPYSITSNILIKLIMQRHCWDTATFLVQYELAERLIAKPSSKEYNRLGIIIQNYCHINLGIIIDSNNFFPKPKIKSRVINLILRKKPLIDFQNYELFIWFLKVLKIIFSQRRKILINVITNNILIDKNLLINKLMKININPSCRAETLTIYEISLLSELLFNENNNNINKN